MDPDRAITRVEEDEPGLGLRIIKEKFQTTGGTLLRVSHCCIKFHSLQRMNPIHQICRSGEADFGGDTYIGRCRILNCLRMPPSMQRTCSRSIESGRLPGPGWFCPRIHRSHAEAILYIDKEGLHQCGGVSYYLHGLSLVPVCIRGRYLERCFIAI